MDELNNIKAVIESVRSSEATPFECDEKAIQEEYKTRKDNKSSITIKILSIFGGFLATLTFLGFLGLAGLYNSETGLLIFGAVFVVTAIWLNKKYDKLIIDTFSISIYVIGFALLGFGLAEMGVDENIISIFIAVIAICSLFVTQNYILSFISIMTVSGCFITLIMINDSYDLIHLYIALYTSLLTYVFLYEAKLISMNQKLSRLYNPLRIGLIMSLLIGLTMIGKSKLVEISQDYIWLSSIVTVLAILYTIDKISKIFKINKFNIKVMIYTFSGLILVPALVAPSISGAILIILLSFLVNYKTGFVIGIISMIYFVSQYYYDLNLTLLTKSIILFSSGILFLLFYVFTIKKLKNNEEV